MQNVFVKKSAMMAILLILFCAIPSVSLAAPPSSSSSSTEPVDYRALASMLEDEHVRNTLIEELRVLENKAASQNSVNEEVVPAKEIAAEAPSGQSAQQVSFARRMAATSQRFVDGLAEQFALLSTAVQGLFASEAEASTGPLPDRANMMQAAGQLLGVIAATFALFILFRAIAGRSFQGLSLWVSRGSEKFTMLRTLVAVVVAGLVDMLAVVLAYAGGGVVSNYLAAGDSTVATRLALFLNAFVIIEMVKVVLRMLFAKRYASLRLVPVSAAQAGYCNRFFANIAGFVGYGVLVLVPILNFNVSPGLGAGISSLIVLIAVLYAAGVILKNRRAIADKLNTRAESSSGPLALLLRLLAKTWHLFALAYALSVLVVSVLHPETALPFVAMATLKTLIYCGAGLLFSVVLGQLIGREISLSDRLNSRMPRLQARVNTYVPTSLKVARSLILIAVVVFTLDAWAVYDLGTWYASDVGIRAVSSLVDILIIMFSAAVVWVILASMVEHRLTPKDTMSSSEAARAETLLGLFNTTLAIAIVVVTVMIVLSEIGVDIAPLIASAGVLGLAIGFGAQKLVQDVITGVFIQLENAMNTGDFVSAGGNSGTVERVGIRSVALRDLYGTYHIVPFSSVGAVSNFTKEFGNHVGEYGIAYRESIDEAIVQLEAAFEELKEGKFKDDILAPLNVAGVVALADSSVNIRVVIKTTPGNQWAVGRAYNRLVKIYFDKAGIEIPFPHTTLYFGEDKDGSAPAGNIRLASDNNVVDTQTGNT
ncbi:small-conductance mechanosensitive channel [Spongiibacter sp. IMCC21906]|uniref:mechanosensitive ion channel domain-containing protein n=1 Tax=Spongiibacter sp. IMCC21906 TaxID=1620392 RepID=UPI00062DD723|nr:mechanosensitive ion channel domain-containing protein [Spongiibacter sp. IMCC21906]AKH67727.1 small-conductance mechanosensitive channel [Spongiibacter sp. IMCC21906]